VMSQSIQQSRGHLGIAKHAGPLGKHQVSRDQGDVPLVVES
jgi:hypothetical protein